LAGRGLVRVLGVELGDCFLRVFEVFGRVPSFVRVRISDPLDSILEFVS